MSLLEYKQRRSDNTLLYYTDHYTPSLSIKRATYITDVNTGIVKSDLLTVIRIRTKHGEIVFSCYTAVGM